MFLWLNTRKKIGYTIIENKSDILLNKEKKKQMKRNKNEMKTNWYLCWWDRIKNNIETKIGHLYEEKQNKRTNKNKKWSKQM